MRIAVRCLRTVCQEMIAPLGQFRLSPPPEISSGPSFGQSLCNDRSLRTVEGGVLLLTLVQMHIRHNPIQPKPS